MGMAQGYENDIFISYAHVDNEALVSGQEGWVNLLHDRLSKRLHQLLGESVAIWRDPKLSGNEVFSETIRANLYNASLLVSVLTPRYLKSKWCQKELNEFYNRALDSGGITIDDKQRIFKIIKTPIHPEEPPHFLQESRGYPFYAEDSKSGRFREFGYDSGTNRDWRYWETLEDLAQDIKELIEKIRSQSAAEPYPIVKPSGRMIYLAETTSTLHDQYLRLKRELQLNGHCVLPDNPLPHTSKFREEVLSLISQCQFAVHLVGDTYGFVPEGESESLVQLQHRLTAGLPRVIWMPAGLTSPDERQQRFISFLLNQGCDLLQDKLEDLKDFIHAKISSPESPAEMKSAPDENGGRNAKVIYLVCDQSDYSVAAPVEDYLYKCGYEVLSFSDDIDMQTHIDNLMLCDAVLTYCGQTTDMWLQKKKSDLMKLPGYGRTKPMLAKGFYISAPRSDARDRFRIQDGVVIRNYSDFTPASLDPFVEEIERAKRMRQ